MIKLKKTLDFIDEFQLQLVKNRENIIFFYFKTFIYKDKAKKKGDMHSNK